MGTVKFKLVLLRRLATANPLYIDNRYNGKIQEILRVVNQKLCKNIVFNTRDTS